MKANHAHTAIALGLAMLVSSATTLADESSERVVCDETCLLALAEPAATEAPAAKEPAYAVVSPVGRPSVAMIRQAPRLDTLSGKTIAVVGQNFMARVTHPEIKRLILEHYPDAKVILQDEIGNAGLYPVPGTFRRDKEEFQRKLKAMKVDAVISGNGGCGLCTPKEAGSCIAAEYVGVPSVLVAGPGFQQFPGRP